MVNDVSIKGMMLLSDVYHICNIVVCEPTDYEEAMNNQKWMIAMKEELSMIEKNKTWILVERPRNRKVIRVKWVYRTKPNVDGSINKNKARLVVTGYNQIFGMDYLDTFAPAARLDTIRLLLVVATQKDLRHYMKIDFQ